MKLSTYLREIANKVDKGTFTKSDIIATIRIITENFETVPDYICEAHFTRKDGIERMVV